jgi:asparagine synthase (glutamine-hydrolysing)
MKDTLLRDTDATSMHSSLEVRVPFLDQPLVDYVSSLPGSLKQPRGGHNKSLLRAAFRDVLPEHVATRPKTGFTLPIGDWMRGPLRDSCEPAISHLAAIPVINGKEVLQLWADFQAGVSRTHWSRPLALVVLGHHLMREGAL